MKSEPEDLMEGRTFIPRMSTAAKKLLIDALKKRRKAKAEKKEKEKKTRQEIEEQNKADYSSSDSSKHPDRRIYNMLMDYRDQSKSSEEIKRKKDRKKKKKEVKTPAVEFDIREEVLNPVDFRNRFRGNTESSGQNQPNKTTKRKQSSQQPEKNLGERKYDFL